MTRTERSVFPRAIVKDRSESKSGLDKSLRKNGAGPHNWGSLADEGYLESAALEDEELELEDDDLQSAHSDESLEKKPSLGRSTSSLTDEEMETAKQVRKNAFKGEGIDLAAIARTSSAVSTSPPKASPVAPRSETV